MKTCSHNQMNISFYFIDPTARRNCQQNGIDKLHLDLYQAYFIIQIKCFFVFMYGANITKYSSKAIVKFSTFFKTNAL